MLQQNAIPPAALELLKKISAIKQLDDFGLGGGTNIALRFGHRLSVDLDFFTNTEFENSSVFIKDVIPMKLQAASNRNAKKDYWDIATLMDKYSLSEMLNIFKQKFPQIDTGFIIHSLTDFEKADTELNPDTLRNITWEEIKLKLTDAVRKYTEGFLKREN